jgi:signal transduction histidine kinase
VGITEGHTAHSHGGSIGLALVKQLIELHGGSIEASSGGPNMGSAFTLKMPNVLIRDGQTLSFSAVLG